MSVISPDRPVFASAAKAAGGASSASTSTMRMLKEAQAAFFRPAADIAPAAEPTSKPVAQITAKPAVSEPVLDRSQMRPGSYLNILV